MTLIRAASAAAALSLALAVTGGIHPAPAWAATTATVNTTLDETQAGDGTCSLREATLYANGAAEPDCAATPASGVTSITLPGGTYLLNGQALSLTGDAALTGAGTAATTVAGGGRSQVLSVASGARVSVSGVTVTGGQSGAACTGNMCVGLGLAVSGFPGGGIVNAGTLTLAGVTVSGNRTSPGATNDTCTQNQKFGCTAGNGGDGGGIFNDKTGTLTIANSIVTGNATGAGGVGTAGAPSSGGGRSGNGGNGGGVANLGTLTITNSTIAGNTTGAGGNGARGGDGAAGVNSGDAGDGSSAGAGGSGGGIENNGPLVISGTTFVGNKTGGGGTGGDGGVGSGAGRHGTGGAGGNGGPGGAIDSSTDMTIANSTLVANATAGGGLAGAGNTPGGFPPAPGQPGIGGGIDQHAMGTTLTHVTITANSAAGAGGGVDGAGGTITIANSIIAGNVAAPPTINCAGVLVNQGGNIEFAATSCPAGFLQADPKLTGLADNGGPTQTIALQPGSAAIHHVRTCVLTHDQRGVARPVGAACDSGAYQVAPPSVGGISAGGITTTSAAIAAAVNPNLKDTKVVVNYGLTPSYGSSTAPSDLGAGNAPAPFMAALVGLHPGTTYHFDVVATNADGTTTSNDGVFTTVPPLTASIAGASTVGPALALTIACNGGFGPGTCAGTIGLTSRTASKHPHPVKVAAGSYSVNSGGRVTVRIRLNQAGRSLLTAHYSLSSTVSLHGTTQVTGGVTFRYKRIKAGMPFTAHFVGDATVFSQLTVEGIPRGGKVTVICRGGGCPFGQRAFAPRHGLVILGRTFRHALLQPGTSIQIKVSAANRVAKVETLTMRSNQAPIVTKQCLPPGASRPAKCVKAK